MKKLIEITENQKEDMEKIINTEFKNFKIDLPKNISQFIEQAIDTEIKRLNKEIVFCFESDLKYPEYK